jgi:acyl dehydratase
MKIGKDDLYSESFLISQKQVEDFARLSGDTNPVHLDPEYAKSTIFGKPIIHGLLGASIFSRILGTVFPGEGTIYLNQQLRFDAPMFVDTEYRAQFKVLEIIKERNRARIETLILNKENEHMITGEALVKNSKAI